MAGDNQNSGPPTGADRVRSGLRNGTRLAERRAIDLGDAVWPIDLTVRATNVYRNIKENWRIVHEHMPFPVDLDTEKPDLLSKQ